MNLFSVSALYSLISVSLSEVFCTSAHSLTFGVNILTSEPHQLQLWNQPLLCAATVVQSLITICFLCARDLPVATAAVQNLGPECPRQIRNSDSLDLA